MPPEYPWNKEVCALLGQFINKSRNNNWGGGGHCETALFPPSFWSPCNYRQSLGPSQLFFSTSQSLYFYLSFYPSFSAAPQIFSITYTHQSVNPESNELLVLVPSKNLRPWRQVVLHSKVESVWTIEFLDSNSAQPFTNRVALKKWLISL